MTSNPKLELTWIERENRPVRILLEDRKESY
jgi:hypothetical protein